jgi:ABC-type lipoprotein release transport system permease subunit
MNPLSAWTYCRRHTARTALLLSLIILVTSGLHLMGALVWGVFVEPGRLAQMALSRFSMVTPESDASGLEPAVIAQIRANPDVAQVIRATTIRIQLPGMMPGESFQFDLLGLMEEDVPYVLERFGATLKAGHLPDPGVNGLLLSEDVATMLSVRVGDTYDAISSEFYVNVDAPLEAVSLEVVGILKSDVELGIVSLEFLNDHESYSQLPARFLVVAQRDRETAIDDFLRNEIQTDQTSVMTLSMLNERIINEALPGLVMLLPVTFVVAIAFSLVVVVVNWMANAQRLPEYGMLHATGRSQKWLVRRVTMETTAPALVGWAIGIGLSWLVLYLLKVALFAPRGHDLNFIAWIPIVFSLPIPATIAGFTFVSVRRTLSRLDPVAVVERGELSQEGDRKRERAASNSSPTPLAPTTFYRRHRRRAVLLISGTSLMILAVALIVFVLAVGANAQDPLLGYLSQVSLVRSPGSGQGLDPGKAAQVKAHPAVERVVPVAPRYSMLSAYIPPFVSAEASPLGVYAEDMAYLVELYGLELREGHLPHPGTNDMVISEILAQNRDLEVGDVIGDPDRPAYPGASSLPAGFVISGIFARPPAPEDESGLGFVSLEFLESQEAYDVPDSPPLIVVPKAGQKDALDDWLENELAGVDASVLTYRQQVTRVQQKAQQDMLAMALMESVIAAVAAIGLAVLNYIYISQRQSEFGVLHALGYGRRRLVGRVLGETALTVAAAWGLSAITALVGMLFLRLVVFEPRGLTFSLFHLTPWLYTLPIPAMVLAVTTGTTARTLSRLDAVAIIEQRP